MQNITKLEIKIQTKLNVSSFCPPAAALHWNVPSPEAELWSSPEGKCVPIQAGNICFEQNGVRELHTFMSWVYLFGHGQHILMNMYVLEEELRNRTKKKQQWNSIVDHKTYNLKVYHFC